MLGLLLIPAMAFQTPTPAVTQLDCATVHDQLAQLKRGASELVRDDDEDKITRTPLTATPPILAYYETGPAVAHVERFSYDTEGYTDTVEITLKAPLIAVRSFFKVKHGVECLPNRGDDLCIMPDIRTSGNPIIMSAKRQGTGTMVSCTKVRER